MFATQHILINTHSNIIHYFLPLILNHKNVHIHTHTSPLKEEKRGKPVVEEKEDVKKVGFHRLEEKSKNPNIFFLSETRRLKEENLRQKFDFSG